MSFQVGEVFLTASLLGAGLVYSQVLLKVKPYNITHGVFGVSLSWGLIIVAMVFENKASSSTVWITGFMLVLCSLFGAYLVHRVTHSAKQTSEINDS